MPIRTEFLGPGTLTLGAADLEVAGQIRNCRIEPSESVTTRNAIPVMSGEEIPEKNSVTVSYTLAGTLLQDWSTAGVVAFSWANEGDEVEFTFTPKTGGPTFTGTVVMVPLTVGGDVVRTDADGDPPAADFSWRCQGKPTPTWAPVGP